MAATTTHDTIHAACFPVRAAGGPRVPQRRFRIHAPHIARTATHPQTGKGPPDQRSPTPHTARARTNSGTHTAAQVPPAPPGGLESERPGVGGGVGRKWVSRG